MSIDYQESAESLCKKYMAPWVEENKKGKFSDESLQRTVDNTSFALGITARAMNEYGAELFERPADINKKIIDFGVKEGTIEQSTINGHTSYNYFRNGEKGFPVSLTASYMEPSIMACMIAHETLEVAKERNPQAKEILTEVETRRQKAGLKPGGGYAQAESELKDLESLESRGKISMKKKDNSAVMTAMMMEKRGGRS